MFRPFRFFLAFVQNELSLKPEFLSVGSSFWLIFYIENSFPSLESKIAKHERIGHQKTSSHNYKSTTRPKCDEIGGIL